MTLHLEDRWIWDFWLAVDGSDHHVFYLQAPRALGDPELRHRNATIGHAVSRDLRSWEVLPDALGAGPPGAWDDHGPWTGSVVRGGSEWRLYYTGASSTDDGLVQRVGMAVSDDLVHWARADEHLVLCADPRWYEKLGDSDWFDEAWRDPWVLAEPDDASRDEYRMFICARVADGPSS